MRNMCAALPQPRARTLLSRLLAVMAKYSAVPSTSTTWSAAAAWLSTVSTGASTGQSIHRSPQGKVRCATCNDCSVFCMGRPSAVSA